MTDHEDIEIELDEDLIAHLDQLAFELSLTREQAAIYLIEKAMSK